MYYMYVSYICMYICIFMLIYVYVYTMCGYLTMLLLKLVSAIFYQIFIFHQMISLQEL